MSGRFWARDRLELMSSVLSLADDLDGVTYAEAAAHLDVDEARIRACVEPLTDLEYVEDGSFFDDITNLIEIEDDRLCLRENWWRDLSALEPLDAVLLHAALLAAGDLPGVSAEGLGRLRRRLAGIAGVVVAGAVPPQAQQLLIAKDERKVVSASLEPPTSMPGDANHRWQVHAVRQVGTAWLAILTPADDPEAPPRTVFVDRLHYVKVLEERHGPLAWVDREEPELEFIEVEIAHEPGERWRLEIFSPQPAGEQDGRPVTRVRVPGRRALETLLLRLGDKGEVVAPNELVGLQGAAAEGVLAVYAV